MKLAILLTGSLIYSSALLVSCSSEIQPLEDGRWSCVDDGNRVCGPSTDNVVVDGVLLSDPTGPRQLRVPAGCYDEGGVLVAYWPCYVAIDSEGNADVYK